MPTAPKYTLTSDSVVISWEGKPVTVRKGHTNFEGLRKAIVNEDWDALPRFLTVEKTLAEYAQGEFKFKDGKFFYGELELPSNMKKKMETMASRGEDPSIILKFYERLRKNPSWRSVTQLFQFLDKENIPLTKDGCFLAYKGVRNDYLDKHSGTWSNKPGVVNKMPRNEISDDPQQACHVGFHVGALGYAKGFAPGGRLVICKVDPEHVVCVPYDASQEKMRVCEYKVVGEWNGEPMDSATFDDYDDVKDTISPKPKEKKQSEASSPPKKAAKGYEKYDKMDASSLFGCTIDELRQYAGKGLSITGASKVPGGKTGLIEVILKVRA